MVKWLERKYGGDTVPWVFFCATIGVCLAGIVGTVFFAVSGIMVGLNVSIPAIIVSLVGILPTGMILEDKNYI